MKNSTLKIQLIIIAIAIITIFWCNQKIDQFANTTLTIQQETIFNLPTGSGWTVLKRLLIRDKIMREDSSLLWMLLVKTKIKKLKAGTYRFIPGITVRQMLKLLISGKEAQFTVCFIEGSRLLDWMKVLRQLKYLQHTLVGKSNEEIALALGLHQVSTPEGQLYPDTYSYTAGMTDIDLLKRAQARMKKMLQDIWDKRSTNLPYKTPFDLLTLASIIEKETAQTNERNKIASVFINRLRIGMRLQTDSTLIYSMGTGYNGHISRQDLETKTSYNTYVITGLPPTPIAMPGKATLKAAANPAKTPYLYFVANGKGGHTFATNLTNHNQAVRTYRHALKEKNER